jgi:hypothetical protein
MFTKVPDISKIAKVYTGKRGCMCGCNGTYRYNEGVEHEDWQGKVSTRSVKIIAKKVFNNPNTVWDESQEYCFVEDRENNTIKVVYFKQ